MRPQLRVRGILQSMTFDGLAVRVRRPLSTQVIPLGQVASVDRYPGRCILVVTDSGGRHHAIRYWTVSGAAATFQREVITARYAPAGVPRRAYTG